MTMHEGTSGFWSTEKWIERAKAEGIIGDFDVANVSHGAYELAVGPEAFLTTEPDGKKISVEKGEEIVIPSGQFALLLTEENIKIPPNALGFISMRFSVKRRGLINVSGFHVDPGYDNRLKFSVYNAGSAAITLQRGQRVFMLWLCDLDRQTKYVYDGKSEEHDRISSRDQDEMRGTVSSPAQLRKEFEELRDKDFATLKNKDFTELASKFDSLKSIYTLVAGLLFAIFVRLLFFPLALFWSPIIPDAKLEAIKEEITAQLRAEQQRVLGPNALPSTTPMPVATPPAPSAPSSQTAAPAKNSTSPTQPKAD